MVFESAGFDLDQSRFESFFVTDQKIRRVPEMASAQVIQSDPGSRMIVNRNGRAEKVVIVHYGDRIFQFGKGIKLISPTGYFAGSAIGEDISFGWHNGGLKA